METNAENEELANFWNDPEIKQSLINRIKQKQEYLTAANDKIKLKLLSNQSIINEFWILWLNIDGKKDPYRKLSNHPKLTLNDFNEINKVANKYREKQFYWAFGFTLGTFGIYSAFFQKKWMFYNFFRKKSRIPLWPTVKKGLGCFMVYWTWVMILNYYYMKQIPYDLKEKKLYEKYNIEYETS